MVSEKDIGAKRGGTLVGLPLAKHSIEDVLFSSTLSHGESMSNAKIAGEVEGLPALSRRGSTLVPLGMESKAGDDRALLLMSAASGENLDVWTGGPALDVCPLSANVSLALPPPGVGFQGGYGALHDSLGAPRLQELRPL
ncbi:hypothetical protein AMTR_s00034p00213290 [Amborella trichopoda]|uniref:Uncharacterized protein n=1 Tax=Amborella trichopoda TaxID=13333 RepID=W1PWJ3_AMBTC|nr:hypothetical protein AMTR_s00034p00213290 [Amborella trichopoda]